jgi:hypothetical protein
LLLSLLGFVVVEWCFIFLIRRRERSPTTSST